MAAHSNNLAWKTPWTEKPRGLSQCDHKKQDTTEHTHTHRDLTIGNLQDGSHGENLPPANQTSPTDKVLQSMKKAA